MRAAGIEAIDALDAAGVAAADAAPDHWRHVRNRVAASPTSCPHGLDRPKFGLGRGAIER